MKKEYLYAGTSILLWSTVATTTKLLLGNLNNLQVLWISAFLAGLFLLIVNIFNGKIRKLKSYTAKDYLISVLVGMPSTFFYYVFYYAGADLLPASQAFIINYLWPVMSIVFACVILKEKITLKKVIAVLISFCGVAIVVSGDIMNFNTNMLLGAIFCMLGAVSYGIFTALSQKVDYDKSNTNMLSYFASFILTSVINFVNGDLFLPGGFELCGFIWNAVFTMAIANTVWVCALAKGNTAKISNLAYITPFLSLVWTSLILKETLALSSVAGLVVIVLGIVIQLKDEKTKV
ncbi:MAG: DMT family transporter [Clostridia bacterium]|nr:DMT family transporter [Clostridia bacterium]